jgi:hypothetical protein
MTMERQSSAMEMPDDALQWRQGRRAALVARIRAGLLAAGHRLTAAQLTAVAERMADISLGPWRVDDERGLRNGH